MINEDAWFSVSNRTKLHLHSFCVFKSPRGWCKLVSGNVDKFRRERERELERVICLWAKKTTSVFNKK